ncbi:hypothetical protein [Actinokineospora xionganensis]|nr:hypothetical protein [Actinokineospora xionganensis]
MKFFGTYQPGASPMSGLTGTILIIAVFLVGVLAVRLTSRH